ncbi:MAG: BrnT family toxin [Bryobacteraceae bacterium]
MQINVAKHGVSFGDAASVFRDPLAVTIFDAGHSSAGDDRWVTIGMASNGASLVVIHTWEDLGSNTARVRIISARKATKAEQRAALEA